MIYESKSDSDHLEVERSVSKWKIRLENFLFPGEAVTGLEARRSVSDLGVKVF